MFKGLYVFTWKDSIFFLGHQFFIKTYLVIFETFKTNPRIRDQGKKFNIQSRFKFQQGKSFAIAYTNNEINSKKTTWFSAVDGGQHLVKLTTCPPNIILDLFRLLA